MKKSELRQLIKEAYNEIILQAQQKEDQMDLNLLDQMFDDPNIRYSNTDSTLICIAKHPKFGPMPVYNQTIKVDRDIQKAGLQKFVSTSGSGFKFKGKSFKSAQQLIGSAKDIVKNIRMKRDGISMKDLATKLNKWYDKMIFDAAKQSGIDLRRGK